MSTTTTRRDVYAEITATIVSQLQKGVRPWAKPWNAAHAAGHVNRPLRAGGEKYRGINVLALWIAAETRGYACPIWMSFKQALDLGGAVRKGEKGTLVVYANRFTVTEQSETGEAIERDIPFMRGYTVFNCEQVAGLSAHFYAKAESICNPDARVAAADMFFARLKADVRHGGNAAFYSPSEDRVQMPDFESFRDKESYYATLAHEMTHWTRHPKRVNRSFEQKRFGDSGYAREELVAEIAAALLCSDLGLASEPREDHASYLDFWLKILKEDSRAIFQAAAHAQRAADYLHGLDATPAA